MNHIEFGRSKYPIGTDKVTLFHDPATGQIWGSSTFHHGDLGCHSTWSQRSELSELSPAQLQHLIHRIEEAVAEENVARAKTGAPQSGSSNYLVEFLVPRLEAELPSRNLEQLKRALRELMPEAPPQGEVRERRLFRSLLRAAGVPPTEVIETSPLPSSALARLFAGAVPLSSSDRGRAARVAQALAASFEQRTLTCADFDELKIPTAMQPDVALQLLFERFPTLRAAAEAEDPAAWVRSLTVAPRFSVESAALNDFDRSLTTTRKRERAGDCLPDGPVTRVIDNGPSGHIQFSTAGGDSLSLNYDLAGRSIDFGFSRRHWNTHRGLDEASEADIQRVISRIEQTQFDARGQAIVDQLLPLLRSGLPSVQRARLEAALREALA